MHDIVEMYDLISSGWSDCNCSGPDLFDFRVASEADCASCRGPAKEIRAMWGYMVCCTRVNHPAGSGSSIQRNREIFIIADLLDLSCSNMRVYRFRCLRTASLVLLLLLLLFCISFLLSALVTLVPILLAVVAFDFAFVCLIALSFNRSNLV
jgi:hypothetical protein